MDLRLEGKVVVITGAVGGIGSATARAFAQEGARLGLTDRDKERLDVLAESITGHGGHVTAIPADLADEAAARRVIADLVNAENGVDVLVNACGALQLAPFDDLTYAGVEQAVRVNTLPAVAATQVVLPVMREQGSGCVLMVTSDLATQPEPIAPAYAAAKAALNVLAKILAKQEGPDGIRVNALAPGPINTPMLQPVKHLAARAHGPSDPELAFELELRRRGQPLGRPGTPEEVAEVLTFLASPCAGYVTGQILGVDGGTLQCL